MCSNNRRADFSFFFPKPNCWETSIRIGTKVEFSSPIYVPSKREKESSRWLEAGHRTAHILLALCMRLNCFRVCCYCNIPEMNQKDSHSHPWAAFQLIHTCMYLCVIMHVCTHVCIFSCAYYYHLCASLFRLTRGLLGHLCVPFEGSLYGKKKTRVCREQELKIPCVVCN